jgi:predicted dehydrogenase
MYDVTCAVAGTGFIGPVHVEALKRLGVRIAGILGSSPEKSREAAAALDLPRAYLHFDEILKDPAVQAVHLAVPNRWHYEMAKKCLAAGKHVMCEKPLAMNSAETADLVASAGMSGLHAGVCYNIRFYPLNLEARQQVRNGGIGDIYSIMGSYVQDWLLFDTDYNWRVMAAQGGPLRAVADIGTHWIDLIYSITGLEVESVFADLRTVHPIRRRPKGEVETFSAGGGELEREVLSIDTEDCGVVLLRFSGGVQGVLWVSQVTAGRKNCLRYEIAGAKRAIAWNSECPNELWIGRRDGPNTLLQRDPALLGAAARYYTNYPGGHNEGFPDTFKQCFRAFYDAILGRDTGVMYPTFAEGHREVALGEAILRSHKEQRWIGV